MRVLVVLPEPPGLEAGAPARGAVALLRGLALHGVAVQAIAAQRRPGTTVPPDLPVEVVDVPPGHSVSRRLSLLRRPRGTLLGPFSERVRELAADADVLHLDQTETAWCNLRIDCPASLHMHFRTLRDRPVPPPWRHEFRFLVEFVAAELFAARRYRSLVASSREVADSLRRLHGGAEVVFAPLALVPEHYARAPLDGPPRPGLIGTAGWPPTGNAIGRLVERVWPRMARAVPDARLTIAGIGTEPLAQRLQVVPRTDWLGRVDSASDFMTQLSVLLYPVSRGSGVKVKVLEAMACGVPVVTTRCGAEGVAASEGVLVCDSDDDLARAATRLLVDADERRQRGEAGRVTFLRDHTPGPAAEPLVDLFRRMAEAAG